MALCSICRKAPSGSNGRCRSCHAEREKERRGTEDPVLRSRREKDSRLRRNYGITLEEYEDLLKKQNGVCAICHKPNNDDRGLHVDHCHNTKKVRGLLCFRCNVLLGKAEDQTHLLRKAANYLERY